MPRRKDVKQIELPVDLCKQAQRLAKEDGVTLTAFVRRAVETAVFDSRPATVQQAEVEVTAAWRRLAEERERRRTCARERDSLKDRLERLYKHISPQYDVHQSWFQVAGHLVDGQVDMLSALANEIDLLEEEERHAQPRGGGHDASDMGQGPDSAELH